MRELTLLDTGYLCGLLVLSLVLPMLLSLRGPQDATARRACLRMVWIGQLLGAAAAAAILLSASIAPFALAFGVISCAACAFMLLRQFRVVQRA